MAKGVDLSFLSAAITAALLYLLLDALLPSARAVREGNVAGTATAR
jgi:hypothetical protein